MLLELGLVESAMRRCWRCSTTGRRCWPMRRGQSRELRLDRRRSSSHASARSPQMPVARNPLPNSFCRSAASMAKTGASSEPLASLLRRNSGMHHLLCRTCAVPCPASRDYYGGSTGSRRTRTRSSPMTTIAPSARSSATWPRLATSSAAWLSGLRVTRPRKRTMLGTVAPKNATSAPKSVSSVTKIRPWATAAREHQRIGRALEPDISCVDVVTVGAEQDDHAWRETFVEEEPHAPRRRGSSRSRTASAAYSRASLTSSASRSG